MKVPAYHLRMNKMVERLLFVDLLHRLDNILPERIDAHTYVGLGGPYLEDFNLIHGTFGNRKMISLEIDDWVVTRQRINRPHSAVELTSQSTTQFTEKFDLLNDALIVWFDYSRQDWAEQISECCELLQKLSPMSILKVTFSGATRKEPPEETATRLSETFANYGPFEDQDVLPKKICRTLYSILEKSIADAIPDTDVRCVRTLASYIYDDGTPILTVTMIVGQLEAVRDLIQNATIRKWRFADLNWSGPKEIAVPSLGLREKLAVDQLLPDADAKTILQTLELQLANKAKDSTKQMNHYLQFYRQVPQFLRVAM
jgi:hypothetical protein